MRVFSACIKMMKQHKWVYLLYFVIFACLFLIPVSGGMTDYGDFTEQNPKYTLLNRDGEGPLVKGLIQVLEANGTFVELEDSKEALMDAGFYQAVESIFWIPEGFETHFWAGEESELEMWQWPSSASGYYLQSAAEQYLSLVSLYRDSGADLSEGEMAEAALKSMEKKTEVEIRQYTDGAVVSGKIRLYQRFLPYVMLLLCISGVSIVFLNFKKPDIRMRNLCSPMKPFSLAFQKFLYVCVVGTSAWVLFNIVGAFICFGDWKGVDWHLPALFLINSFAMALVSVASALLCSAFISSQNTQSFVSNIYALVMCFLGGTFVQLDLLGSGILKIAKFVPVYWYEENVEKICSLTGFGVENLGPVYRGMLIQLGFAAAFFCIYLVMNKYQQQAAESFGSVRTEIEQ